MFDKEDIELLRKEYHRMSINQLMKEHNGIDSSIYSLVKSRDLEEFNKYFMDYLCLDNIVVKTFNDKIQKKIDKERNFLIEEFGSMSLEELKEEQEALDYDIMDIVHSDLKTFNKYFMPSLRESGLINTFIEEKEMIKTYNI